MIESGSHFTVFLVFGYAFKWLKEKRLDIKRIANVQNEMSLIFDEVLPCKRIGRLIIMKQAKGIRVDKTKEWKKARKIRDMVVTKAKKHGYKVTDIGQRDMFLDGDKLTIVDFSQVWRSII